MTAVVLFFCILVYIKLRWRSSFDIRHLLNLLMALDMQIVIVVSGLSQLDNCVKYVAQYSSMDAWGKPLSVIADDSIK